MKTIVIVGWRSKGWRHPGSEDPCTGVVRYIIEDLQQSAMLEQVRVCSIGTDSGIGAVVKASCTTFGVPFFEYKVQFQGGSQEEYLSGYVARHAALLEVGDEFHIFVSGSRKSIIENLVERVKRSDCSYRLYNERGEVIEERLVDQLWGRVVGTL